VSDAVFRPAARDLDQDDAARLNCEPGGFHARGVVGPPLTQIANRIYIAGVLTNTPDNLSLNGFKTGLVSTSTAMPNLGVDEAAARDTAAYLFTLR